MAGSGTPTRTTSRIFTEHRDTLRYLQDDGVGVGVEVSKDGGAIVAEGTPETIAAHHATAAIPSTTFVPDARLR